MHTHNEKTVYNESIITNEWALYNSSIIQNYISGTDNLILIYNQLHA